jgi:hypothetical protein
VSDQKCVSTFPSLSGDARRVLASSSSGSEKRRRVWIVVDLAGALRIAFPNFPRVKFLKFDVYGYLVNRQLHATVVSWFLPDIDPWKKALVQFGDVSLGSPSSCLFIIRM